MDLSGLWRSVLGELELNTSGAEFNTWFKELEIIALNEEKITIGVKNSFVKNQMRKKYADKIKSALKNNNIDAKIIDYVVVSTGKKTVVNRETTATPSNQPSTQSPVTNLISNSRVSSQTSGLNPRYTFDNFIVGGSNDLAHAACQAVASNPGVKYNPLFLYGGVGLGKTHLMQAVGNEIIKNNPNARVLYITIETFVSEFIAHTRAKKTTGFSEKYRNVDVLIVDDMQFIAGKEKTQEEFFHTFNELHQNNKQIIISSDKPPKSIPTLTDRLKSRFEWGMAIDIQMPDFETRCAIIEAKAALSNVTLEKETVEYIASNIKTNVRELEGALNQLLAYAEMRQITPDISIAEGLLGSVRSSRPQHITPKNIIDKTAKYFQISASEICSAKRSKDIVMPRQIAMYLLRSELHLSFPRIASELGRKDHTTAMHSIEKIEKASKLDLVVREQINEIREKIYA